MEQQSHGDQVGTTARRKGLEKEPGVLSEYMGLAGQMQGLQLGKQIS